MIVMVTGLPASGKSTLAALLSNALRLPVLSKDVVKEAIHDCAGLSDRAAVSHASAEVIWRLLPHFPAGAIVEMWCDPARDAGLAADGLRRAGRMGDSVEVMCSCPGTVAAARYRRRTRSGAHRRADIATLERIERSGPIMVPLGVGPTLRVDSTVSFDIRGIVEWLLDKGAGRTSTTSP